MDVALGMNGNAYGRNESKQRSAGECEQPLGKAVSLDVK